MQTKYDPMLALHERKSLAQLRASQVTIHNRLFMLRLDYMGAYDEAIGTYNIYDGFVYPRLPGGSSRERYYACKFQARLYQPYEFLSVMLEPFRHDFSMESLMTTVDYPKDRPADKVEWVKRSVCGFYHDVLNLLENQLNSTSTKAKQAEFAFNLPHYKGNSK